MGCGSSEGVRSSLPHLVIVGFQFGGFNLLQQVKDKFRVTVIDRKDFFEWSCAAPASIHQKGYFERTSTSYHKAINSKKVFGSGVKFIQGSVVDLVDSHKLSYVPTKGKKAGNLKGPTKDLRFDFLAICTGSDWSANHDSEEFVNMTSVKEKSKFYESYREKIDKAKSILIVGGGPTGVEMAGEILIKYKGSKKLGLITKNLDLIPDFIEKAGNKAEEHFEKKDLELHFSS